MTQINAPKPSGYRATKNVVKVSLAEKVIDSIAGLHREGYRSMTRPLLRQLVLDYSKAYRNDNIDDQSKTIDTYLYQLAGRIKAAGRINDYTDLLETEHDGSLRINDDAVIRWNSSPLS